MRSRGRILGAAAAVAASLGLLITSPASAEGRLPFPANGVTSGQVLAYWHDANSDAESTAIKFAYCTSNPRIRIDKLVNGGWQANSHSPIAYCLNTDGGWHNWGDMSAGDYRLVVPDTRSGGRAINIQQVIIKW